MKTRYCHTYLHEFQFQVLSHVIILNDTENGCDYVSGGIAQIIQLLETRTGIIEFPFKYMAYHALHVQRVRLVTYLKTNS